MTSCPSRKSARRKAGTEMMDSDDSRMMEDVLLLISVDLKIWDGNCLKKEVGMVKFNCQYLGGVHPHRHRAIIISGRGVRIHGGTL